MRIVEAETAIAEGERPFWLLSMALLDGRVLRLATRPVIVTSGSSGFGPLQFDPFLVGVEEFEEELDLFSLDGVGALTQARVEIATPGTDLGGLQGDWYHVTAATVELALLWDGQPWEDRLVVLSGTVQEAELGLEGQGHAFALETTPPATSDTIGDDDRDVGTDWPAPLFDDAAVEMSDLAGSKYVHVYGAPESIPAYKVGAAGGASNYLLLSGHPLVRSGASYPVTVYEDGVSVGTYTVTNGADSATVVDAALFAAGNGAYTWAATYGGVAAADGADRPALNAEGVIRRLLVDSGLAVDWRQTEPALARLRDWRIGLWTDQEVTAIELLRDRVFPHLPVVEMAGASGLWLAYSDPHLAEIEADLLLGVHLLGRVGRMAISDLDAIRNSFRLNYAPEASSDTLAATATLDADNSSLCLFSQQLYGVRADDPIDCDVTWDPATALRILGARASRLALPRRILRYEVAPDAYWIVAGMVVRLTDPDYGIASHRAVCSAVNRTMYPFRATFQLIDRTPFAD